MPPSATLVQSSASPRRFPDHLLVDLAGAIAVCVMLLGSLPLAIAVLAGTATAILLARPQVIVLAGMVAVPLLGDSPNLNRGLLLLVAMLGVSSGRHSLEGRARRPARATVALPLLVVWIATSVVLTPAGPLGGPSTSEVIQPLVGATVALVAALFPIHARELAAAAVPGVLLVSLSIIQGSTGEAGRVRALGLNPDYLAILVVLMLAAALVGGLSSRLTILANLAVWPVGLLALERTQSRGALIALAVGISAYFLSRHRDRLLERRRLVLGIVTVLVVLVALPWLVDTLAAQFLSTRTELDYASSNQERKLALLGSLRLIVEHPALGIGYGHFPSVAAGLPGLLDYVNTHNEYTRFGAELGVVGLILLMMPLLSAIRSAAGARSRNVLAVLLAMAAGMLAGNFLNSVVTAYPFWVALGMGLSLRATALDPHGRRRRRYLGVQDSTSSERTRP